MAIIVIVTTIKEIYHLGYRTYKKLMVRIVNNNNKGKKYTFDLDMGVQVLASRPTTRSTGRLGVLKLFLDGVCGQEI